MIQHEYFRIAIRIFLVLWILTSLVAIAGMYQLWWHRERALYLGKSVERQREVVFQRAGFPSSLVAKISLLDRQWPPFVHYAAKGDVTTLSYIKYLLIPRIPSGQGTHSIAMFALIILIDARRKLRN